MNSSLMIILIGTSGAGKTTLSDYALGNKKQIKKLISITDRPPRTTEKEGIDKFFVDPRTFQQLNDQGELCLVNEVYGNMYAFRKSDFESNCIYLGELHYKSLNQFKMFHSNTISIYIKSEIDAALNGLYSRGSSQEEIAIRRRMFGLG